MKPKQHIDYDATLQKFFKQCIAYLEKLQKNTKDKSAAYKITAGIDMVKRIAAKPMAFADYRARINDGIRDDALAAAFIPQGTNDNSMFLTFSAVVSSMGDLKSQSEHRREQAQKKLLAASKTAQYKTSSSMFKDFKFPFLSPEHFAVKTSQYQI